MKVTDAPSQIVVVDAEMLTSGSTLVVVIVIGLLVAGPDAQARSLVMMTVTTSPSCNVVVVKVGESVPALTPLTCHW